VTGSESNGSAAGGPVIDESFQTTDMTVAEEMVRRVYPRAELRESKRDFWFEQSTAGSDGVTFARFKFTSEIDIAVEFDGIAGFGQVLHGDYVAESNRQPLDSSHPFLFRPGLGTSKSEQLDILMVNIDLDVLARHAAQQLGAETARLDFHGHAAVSDTLRAHWLRTVGYAWRSVVRDREVLHNDAIRRATFEAVAASALATFPITAKGPVRMPHAVASSAIRRAQHYISDNADQPLTVAEIAAAARLSVRALQAGFRREFGTTPVAYLREVRLEAARADLVKADPTQEQVAEVARRWAFANAGRFAAQYRERFGEYPTETLRR
jgi:AraC-like DNA-binding protein